MKVEMTKTYKNIVYLLPKLLHEKLAKIARSCDEFSERLQIVLFTLRDPELNAVHNATADV